MKITKSKLKQLIREEISKVIPEVYYLEPKGKPRAAYQDYENEDFQYENAANMQNSVSNILELHKELWDDFYDIEEERTDKVDYDPDPGGAGTADKYLERIYREMGEPFAFLVSKYLEKNKIPAEQLSSDVLNPDEDSRDYEYYTDLPK